MHSRKKKSGVMWGGKELTFDQRKERFEIKLYVQ